MTTPTTNVPAITWVNGMPVIPSESDVRAGRAADFTQVFGSALNTSGTTPQGQIISSDTAIIGDANSQIAYVASMVDPNQAEGEWQDAIGAIYFLQRIAAAGSVKTVLCIGAYDTPIPAGSLIQDPSGYFWAATNSATIYNEAITLTYQCTTTGPIPWAANTPCTIYTSVPGLDQVVGTTAAVLGNLVESRGAFENRRRQSVAINSHGTCPTILGNILALPNVLSAYVIDNPTGSTVTVGSTAYALQPHSILVSCYGGAAASIANAIWTGKDGGCAYNGNTTYTVADTSYPLGSQPQYPITWLTPTPTPIYILVTINPNPALPANIASLISAAALATFEGTDAQDSIPAGIALTISGSRYAPQMNLISPALAITSIMVGFQTSVVDENIGTGNGATANFTHTAAHLSVVPGTVTVIAGAIEATDDGNGNLTGTGIFSGTINYFSGNINISYSTPPASGLPVTLDYSYANPTSPILNIGVDQIPTLSLDAVVTFIT